MALTLTRSIPVNRESLRSGSKFIARAEIEIKRGSSILLFPEGTRSKTGTMRIFKEGAFLLAKKTGCPDYPHCPHRIRKHLSQKLLDHGKSTYPYKGA